MSYEPLQREMSLTFCLLFPEISFPCFDPKLHSKSSFLKKKIILNCTGYSTDFQKLIMVINIIIFKIKGVKMKVNVDN